MKHELFNQWLRDGQPAMSEALRVHLGACTRCSGEFDEIQAFKTLMAAPDPVLSEKRSAEIRFVLEAESNRKRSTRELESHPRPWFFRIPWAAAVAAAVVAVVLVGGVLLHRLAAAPDGSGTVDSLARVTPAPGARWTRVHMTNTEIVMLEEGTIGLQVTRLSPGQAFMVKTGGDWVEVRGTSFSVTAGDGRLQAVVVTEGVVSVHVSSESLLLLAGQQWIRPSKAPAPPENPASNAVASDGQGPPAAPVVADAPHLPVPPTGPRMTPPAVPADSMTPPATKVAPADSMTPPAKKVAPADSMTPPAKKVAPAEPPAEPPAESPLLIRFSEAYRTLQSGHWRKAVTLFSELLQERGLGSRRADVLFWLAQAHLKGDQHPQAIARLQEFLSTYPHSWRAKDAKEQLRILQTEK